jgi:hypothetical protein
MRRLQRVRMMVDLGKVLREKRTAFSSALRAPLNITTAGMRAGKVQKSIQTLETRMDSEDCLLWAVALICVAHYLFALLLHPTLTLVLSVSGSRTVSLVS